MFGLARLQIAGIALALLVVTHGATYAFGWHKGYGAAEAKWAQERLQIMAQAEARARVLREQGDRLAAELEQARAAVRVEYIETVRTIYRTAKATKECFSPDVTAALNRASVIRETVERPGEPPRQVEPAAPTGGTSELAAAEWIANAQSAHEACRAQVTALIDWVRAATGRR